MKKKPSPLKIIGIVLLCLVVLVLIAAVAGYIYLNSLLDMMDREEIVGDDSLSEEEVYEEEPTYDVPDSEEEIEDAWQDYEDVQDTEVLDKQNIENILLIGSDRLTKNQNGRADSMMILSINHDTGHIHLVSLMRAMYVNIHRKSGETWGMLNASYSWGGTALLIDTIERNFRVEIHHYVVVDFDSFENAIDLLGGVEVTLTRAEASYMSECIREEFYPGKQILNGQQARFYCQIRKIDSDFKRTSRQRTVILSLINKFSKSDVSQLTNLAKQLLPTVKTDLTNADVLRLLMEAPRLLKDPPQQRMLPIENENGSYTGMIYVNGREMYKVDFETNIKALHELLES